MAADGGGGRQGQGHGEDHGLVHHRLRPLGVARLNRARKRRQKRHAGGRPTRPSGN